MAVARDAATDLGLVFATSLTAAHTCTGADRALVVGFFETYTGSPNSCSVTYDGVAMTEIGAAIQCPGDRWIHCFLLLNPSAGTHNVVINAGSADAIEAIAASWTGANGSGQPDAHTTNSASSSGNINTSLTTIADNCWTILLVKNHNGAASAGTGSSLVLTSGDLHIYDSNGVVHPAGSNSMDVTSAGSDWATIMFSLAPVSAAGVTVAVTGSIPVGGSATATVGVAAAVTGSIPVGGGATATVGVLATVTGSVPVGGGATIVVTSGVVCSVTGSVPVGGSAALLILVSFAATGSVPIGGSATGLVRVTCVVSGSVTVGGSAAATVTVAGAVTGSVPVGGGATLVVTTTSVTIHVTGFVPVAGSATLTVTGTAGPAAVCTLFTVIETAQQETGLELASVSTFDELSRRVLRYRQRLLARCANRWKDIQNGTFAVDIVLPLGWGDSFDDTWGGASETLDIPAMETVWEVRAHRIIEDDWPIVHVVSIVEAARSLRPALLLRQNEAVLLNFADDWVGIYDQIRFDGVAVPSVDGVDAMTDALEPNQLVGPAFCRCLELDAARMMLLQNDDVTAAGLITVELKEAEADLLRQVGSHNLTVASRQCQRP